MKQGERVELTADHLDENGVTFKCGQRGRVVLVGVGQVIIDFDGYEAERASAAAFRAKHGEGVNVPPWVGVIPYTKLQEAGPLQPA